MTEYSPLRNGGYSYILRHGAHMAEGAKSPQPYGWLRRLNNTPPCDLVRGKITGRLDFERRFEADLGKPLAIHIRRIIRKTGLLPGEKALAAEELADQCRCDLADDLSSKDIVLKLDRKPIVKSIRRRFIQRRSRFLRISMMLLVGFIWVFGSLLVLYLCAAVYLYFKHPTLTVDYLALINKPPVAVPAADRAWPIYREAISLLDAHGDMADELTRRGNSPEDPAWDESRVYLETHQSGFGKLREATVMPGLGLSARYAWQWEDQDAFALFGPDEDDPTRPNTWGPPEGIEAELPLLLQDILPPFRNDRHLARLLAADAFYAAEQGDADRFCDTVDALLGLSEHACEIDHDWGFLHSTAIKIITFGMLTDVLVHDSSFLSDEHLEWIAASLRRDAEYIHPAPLTQYHKINDIIQHLYTDFGPGGGLMSAEGVFRFHVMNHFNDQPFHEKTARVTSVLTAPALAVMLAPRGSLEVLLEESMQAAKDEWMVPMWEQSASKADELTHGKDWSTFQRIRYFPIPIYSGSFNALRKVSARNSAFRQGVLAGIALEHYHRDNGAWPERLDELAPKYLDTLPIDPITGGEAMYLVREGNPVVYSVGRDRDDDQGRLPINDNDGEPSIREAQSWSDPEDHDGDWVLFPFPVTPRAHGRDQVKREAEQAELEAKLRESGDWYEAGPYGWSYYPPEEIDPDTTEDEQGESASP